MSLKVAFLFSLFFFCLLSAQKVFAYPNFIGHGYNACLTCHYNAYGGGPLTDYGRALGAVEVSAKWLTSGSTTDDTLAKRSGLLFSRPKQNWFRGGVNYRGLSIIMAPGKDHQESEYIHMMGNVSGVLKLDKRDKYIIAASMGYAPRPRSDRTGDYKEYRSREYYIGLRPNENFGLYIGLLDKVFGLRVPDHNAYSKTLTSLAMNDQAHGFLAHMRREKLELGLHYFMGNLGQEKELRQVGFSAKMDYLFNETTKAGLSGLASKSEFVEDKIIAIHLKKGIGKEGSSLMFELGHMKKKAPLRGTEVASDYGFVQTHIRLTRGLYYLGTIEYLKKNKEQSDYTMRIIPGLQIFPAQRLELRFEVINTRNFSDTSVLEDSWAVLSQVHLWF